MGFDFVPRGEGSFSEDTRVAAALILVLLLLGLSNFFFLGIQKAELVGGGQLSWVGIDFHDECNFERTYFNLRIIENLTSPWLRQILISRSKHESRTYPSLETITSPPPPTSSLKLVSRRDPFLTSDFSYLHPPWHHGKDNGVHALGVGQGASGITHHKVNMNHPGNPYIRYA